MPRRLAVSVVLVLSALTFVLVLSALAPRSPEPPVAASPPAQHPAAASVPVIHVELASAAADPCADFDALRAGHGEPVRQDWYNHLRTDGAEPDYLRYYVACQPEHDGGRFWAPAYGTTSDDHRWSTGEYNCIRGLLNGEHGGLAWDTDHHNGEGPNPPQAKPVSKLAGLTLRQTYEWMADYVNGRYGSPFHTPNPCAAGY